MKRSVRTVARRAIFWMCMSQCAMAATHFVVMPGTSGVVPADPYSAWETAGTNIATVVSAAMTNAAPKLVWVADGSYYPTHSITASGGVTLRSVNGRDATIVDGRDNPDRGFHFTTSTLDGFTITNHNTSSGNGAGVYGNAMTLINCSKTIIRPELSNMAAAST